MERPKRPPRSLLALSGGIAAVAVLPVFYLFVRASEGGIGGALEVISSGRTASLAWRTIALSASVTAAAIALGVALAWVTSRTDLPFRRILAVGAALPLVIPSYVAAYAFIAATGPTGVVSELLAPLGLGPLPLARGFFGAWLVLTLITYPYVFLPVRAASLGIESSIEDAALLGAGKLRAFMRVVLPQLRPAIAGGGLLVALYTLHDFGAVSLLRFDTFTLSIYTQYQGAFDRTAASTLSLLLVAGSLAVVGLESRTRPQASYHPLHAGGGRSLRTFSLNRWKWPLWASAGLVTTVALLLPVAVIAVWGARGIRQSVGVGFTFEAAANSLLVSAAGAVVVLVASVPIALLAARYRTPVATLFSDLSHAGYALPGVVVALALVFLGIRVVPSLYQTIPMLLAAYLILFLPESVGTIRAALVQISPSLEEAAGVLGVSKVASIWKVTLPLARPGLAAGAALVFLTAMKELPATLLLAPPGFQTLATGVWAASSEALFAKAAAPALAILVLSSIPLAFLVTRTKIPLPEEGPRP